MTIEEFTERLKADGVYIGEDNHLHRADGRLLSFMCRNGYYMTRKRYDATIYNFMEHRVIWCLHYGTIDPELVINHIDFDRANNAIENLELVTQKQNMAHSIENGRMNWLKDPESPRAYMTEKDVQLIRYLRKHGYSRKLVSDMYGLKHKNLISRVVTGARYGNVLDADSVISIYPLLVEKTSRKDLPKDERIMNAILGMCGEIGELVDIFKKHYFQGHELDVNHVIEETGDVMYYLCWLLIELDEDIAEVCFENMVKLEHRYPNGFSAERSINRKE
jgi:NTP pyrophosphatase (non-canonical NTP hydrolase)